MEIQRESLYCIFYSVICRAIITRVVIPMYVFSRILQKQVVTLAIWLLMNCEFDRIRLVKGKQP